MGASGQRGGSKSVILEWGPCILVSMRCEELVLVRGEVTTWHFLGPLLFPAASYFIISAEGYHRGWKGTSSCGKVKTFCVCPLAAKVS